MRGIVRYCWHAVCEAPTGARVNIGIAGPSYRILFPGHIMLAGSSLHYQFLFGLSSSSTIMHACVRYM